MPSSSAGENTRGILFMIAACTGFIVNDTFVKLASEDLSIPQAIILRSAFALPLLAVFCWQQGLLRNLLKVGDRYLWMRTIGEIGGTALYLTALARMDIANATAIAQLTPLAVTAGAALLLGEKVGLRRWSAIVIGLAAVLLIIRPGMSGFNAWSILVVATVGFVVLRDLSSRAMPMTIHPLTVTILSVGILIPLGLAMLPFEPWRPVTGRAAFHCAASGLCLSMAYMLIVHAMRHGEVSVVAPFRYSILIWAIVIQIAVFSVVPDALTLLGSAILVATGLYTVYRERQVKGVAAASRDAAPAAVPPPS